MHWPFYFENRNPQFDVEMTKLQDEAADALLIEAVFADNTNNGIGSPIPLPDVAVGQTACVTARAVYSTIPGQTRLRLPFPNGSYHTVYSYQVRPIEQVWLAGWGVLASLVTGGVGTAVGALIL